MANFTDNFLKALQDDRIQKNLHDILETSIKLIIDEKFNNFQSSMKRTVDGLSATIDVLRNELKIKDDAMSQLKIQNEQLSKELNNVKTTNDELEQFCRKDNLVITGVHASYAEQAATPAGATAASAESSAETVHKVTMLFQSELKCAGITEADISTAHRLPSKSGAPPPIIVRFIRRRDRDLVYHARMELKKFNQTRAVGTKIFINEDLSPHNRQIFSTAWRMKASHDLDGVWTTNCRVIVKKNGATHRITSLEQLRAL